MSLCLSSVCPSLMSYSPGPTQAFVLLKGRCSFRGQALIVPMRVCVCVCCRCRLCRCSLLPHCYTHMGDSGTLVCSHHPADGQVTEPEPSAPAGNRVRGSPQAALPLGGSGAVGSAARDTESTQSEDKLVSEAADMEGKDGEETSAEGADSPAGGQRTGGRGDPSGSRDPRAPAVADAALAEAESLGPAPKVTQWPQEQIGKSGPTPRCTSSPCSIPVLGWASSHPQPPWLRPLILLWDIYFFVSIFKLNILSLFHPLIILPEIFVFLSTFCAQKIQPASVPVQAGHQGGQSCLQQR